MAAPSDHVARVYLWCRGYRSHRVETSAGNVHVLDGPGGGKLPPLVLLHGFSASSTNFLPMLEPLRRGVRRLFAPDLLAHGFSDAPREIHGGSLASGLAEALDAVLDEPAVLFGNSMGAVGAIRYALARPERVRALVLCSPGGASMTREELGLFQRTFRLETHAEALDFVDRLLARPSPIRHLVAWGVKKRFDRPEMKALLDSFTPSDCLRPEDLSALRTPVLLLWGKAERILPASHLTFFERHLPGHARIERPAHMGHSPFLDDPGGVAQRVLSFMGAL